MKRNITALLLIIAMLFISSCSKGIERISDGDNKSFGNDTVENEDLKNNDIYLERDQNFYLYPQDEDEQYEDYSPEAKSPTVAEEDLAALPQIVDEDYLQINENKPVNTVASPVLTFSLKVDTASYRNVARYINDSQLPPADAVRIEEMINYFKYSIPLKQNKEEPFAIYTEIGASPFDQSKSLAFVRVKTKDIDKSELPPCNLTFLIDTSGSMDSYDKLPLLKSAFSLLVETLDKDDTVSIVTYAGSSEIVLDSVSGDKKDKIIHAIENLSAGGSTAGADGIRTAYDLAKKNFEKNGNNRVILATDGDFNVGISSVGELEEFITEKRQNQLYLSVLGFGTGNIKDDNMETLAKNGNGNYSYIDSLAQAKRALVDEFTSNMYAIANDVKAQVEFNPELVESYRLLGYENRVMDNRDFTDDTKDAGEIGVGTDVVMLFEFTKKPDQPLKYQPQKTAAILKSEFSDEFFEVRIRYKTPGENVSSEVRHPVRVDRVFDKNSGDFQLAASLAGFGQLLRGSDYLGGFDIEKALDYAEGSAIIEDSADKQEYIGLLKLYRGMR